MAVNRIEEHDLWGTFTPKQKRGVLAMKENLIVKGGVALTPEGKDVSHIVEVTLKTSDAQAKGFKAKEEMREHAEENGNFVFAFFNACKTMQEEFPTLSQSDLARVMFVGTFAGHRTGKLKHDNGVSINKDALAELVGISRQKFNVFFRSIVDCGVLAVKDGALFVNPRYFYRGEIEFVEHLTEGRQYTRMYRKTMRDLYAMYNGRAIKQLALIYAMLPFVNFSYNVISYNPDEVDADFVRPITLDKLAALLGYKETKKLVVALRGLKYEGESVFAFVEVDGDRRKKKVIVNPKVIYAGNGKSLDLIKILFK